MCKWVSPCPPPPLPTLDVVDYAPILGVTSCPPSRTPYTHDVRIFYISSLSMLFDVCEQCWYQRCVTSIEIGGDVLALGIRFIECIMFEVFLKLAEIEASFWAPLETSMCIYTF